MKISLKMDGDSRSAKLPYDGAEFVIADGTCPVCDVAPFKIRGVEVEHTHDEYHAQAVCLGCKGRIGKLVVKVSTIFGIEEDERVLNGRCRVY